MKTVALIGAEGYLGQHTRAELKNAGYNVFSMDALLWEGQVAEEGTWVGDAASEEGLAVLKDVAPDCIVYLGAVAHDPGGKTPREFAKYHTAYAPMTIRDRFRSTPFVFASSMSVFDSNWKRDSYGGDKDLAEGWIHEKNSAILRFGTLWGPGHTVGSFREHLLLNSMVLSAIRERKVYVRNPKARRPLYEVESAADRVVNAVRGFFGNTGFFGGTIENHYEEMRTIKSYGDGVARAYHGVEVICEEGVDKRDYTFGTDTDWYPLWPDIATLAQWLEEHKGEIKPKKYKGVA